jgi:apolipoprotein N-acyltransferase
VAASAAAFALYARVDRPWLVLGWLGLVPWLASLDRARSARAALGTGLLMCAAFVVAVFAWFADAIATYTGTPWPLAVVALLVAAPLLQPQLIVFALARHLARGGGAGFWRTAVTGAASYVGAEWACGKLFADTLGHGLYASPWMRQAADVGGAHGLTFVLLIGNESVLAAVRATRRGRARDALAPAACVAALVVGLLAYGAVRCRQLAGATGGEPAVTAGVVQADVSQYGRLAGELGTFEAVRRILDAHFTLSAEALGRGDLDLLVWPETVYPTTFGSPKSEAGADFDREIGAFVAGARVPLVFGAYDADGGHEYNAAVFLEPPTGGRLAFETYRKASLFPLTEHVPALLESERIRRLLPWLGAWTPGAGPQVVTLALGGGRTLRIAPLICYDAVDPAFTVAAVRAGAELIVTLSNDSWFAVGGGPRLHLVVSAFRSIETRRPQVRATNTGISAVIDPTGELLTTAGVHERTALVAAVTPERGARTLVLAWGNWFGPTALVAGVLLLVAGQGPRRTGSSSRPRSTAVRRRTGGA